MEIKKTNRFQELDALRGVAALMVVFFHFTMNRVGYNTVFKLGTTGVDLFFIISGFVIFMSIQKVSNSKEFIINRVSRLYPTYWAAVCFAFIIVTSFSIYKGNFVLLNSIKNLFGNLTMFQYYLRISDLDGPYWTMIIEMIFYISIVFLYQFNLLKNINIIGIIACIGITVVTYFFHTHKFVNYYLYWIPLTQYIPLFFAGAIFYKIYTEKTDLLKRYSIIVLCFFCQLTLFNYAGRSKEFINFNEYTIMLSTFFILFILFINHKLNIIVNNITLFLGKISFALYLTHQLISINFILPFLINKLNLNFWLASIFINLPIVIGIATFITFKIEVPYSKKLKDNLRLIFLVSK